MRANSSKSSLSYTAVPAVLLYGTYKQGRKGALLVSCYTLQAPENDVKAVLLSEEGVSGGKAKVLRSEDEIRDSLNAAASAENKDDARDSTEGQEAAAAVVS